MAGHALHPPDLTMLPEGERPVVARALAKNPEERWPTCREFIEALTKVAPSPSTPAAEFAQATGGGSGRTEPPAVAPPSLKRTAPATAGPRSAPVIPRSRQGRAH